MKTYNRYSQRGNPDFYDLPYDKIKAGKFTAEYFNRAKYIVNQEGVGHEVTMQVFQKDHSMVCGLDEVVAVLRKCATNPERLDVWALPEGSMAAPWETVMTIHGDIADFVHLESVYLGILKDATTAATNMKRLVDAAGDTPILYMGDRFNGFENQARQGEAVLRAGAGSVCTDAMVSQWNQTRPDPLIAEGRPVYTERVRAQGTMAHALIASFGGDVVAATKAFHDHYGRENGEYTINTISLVDFNNDCVRDAIACAEAMKNEDPALWGVRLDTSEKMVDKSLMGRVNSANLNGVCPELVWNVRQGLSGAGFPDVKIVVSGGFNVAKIEAFKAAGVPVDAFGVGSSVLKGGSDFTADIVLPVSKQGRQLNPNSRLERI